MKKPQSTPAPETKKEVVKEDFFQQIKSNQSIDFQQVKIKSNIDFKSESTSGVPLLEAVFYIEKNQKIWTNVSALFINVARMLIEQDRVQGYEKWNRVYVDTDFKYFNQQFNVNFFDYQAFESLLVGRNFIPLDENIFSIEKKENAFLIQSKKGYEFLVEGKKVIYDVSMRFDENYRLENVVIIPQNEPEKSLEINYENWQEIQQNFWPKNVKIIIKGKKNAQILIENTKFEFEKMNTPYVVPSNYQKIKI